MFDFKLLPKPRTEKLGLQSNNSAFDRSLIEYLYFLWGFQLRIMSVKYKNAFDGYPIGLSKRIAAFTALR